VNDTADGHERAKDFLSEGELATFVALAGGGSLTLNRIPEINRFEQIVW
jgi:hypothetical protein